MVEAAYFFALKNFKRHKEHKAFVNSVFFVPFVLKMQVASMAIAMAAALAAEASPKFVAHGWDLLAAPPEAIAERADAFAAAGVDGVAICLQATEQSDRSVISAISLPQDSPWRYETVAKFERPLKTISATPALTDNFLISLWNFRRGRLGLTDDAAWARFANNMRVLARLAKRGGMKGLMIDAEDYTKVRQFSRVAGDPGYDTAAQIARRRGREVFSGVFEEFPDVTLLSFWFFTHDGAALRSFDPAAMVRAENSLWPHFLNGMLDVMPMTATLVDGDEGAYKFDSPAAFNAGAVRQLTTALALVAPENRDKFRARTRVGFGQYIDMYVNEEGKSGSWYFGPVAGSRQEHFRRNLASAAETADYVWIYGEKLSWIDWGKKPPFHKTRGYNHHVSWESKLPGLADILAELCDPQMAAQSLADKLRASGAPNLYAANIRRRWTAPKSDLASFSVADGDPSSLDVRDIASASFHVPVDGVREGETFVADFRLKGDLGGVAEVIWRTDGPFNWSLGRHYMAASTPDARGGRRYSRIFHAPEGADGLMFRINVRQLPGEHAAFSDIAIFRLPDQNTTTSIQEEKQ